MPDQEGATTYSRLVKQIEELEASSQKAESGNVDISRSFLAGGSDNRADYKAVIDVVEEIEKKGGVFQKQRQAREEPAQKGRQAEQVPLTTPAIEEQVAVSPESLASYNAEVRAQKELEELTKSLPVKMPLFEAQKIRKVDPDLVLPNLSLSDQVAELERIIDGLRSNIFVGDEREIVEEELYGLLETVQKEKKTMKKKKSVSEDEIQLLGVRDKRLTDAITLLQHTGKR